MFDYAEEVEGEEKNEDAGENIVEEEFKDEEEAMDKEQDIDEDEAIEENADTFKKKN